MKNKLGIFTALILSLIIVGSVFASPEKVSVKKSAALNSSVSKTSAKKKVRHRHHKRKVMKKKPTMVTPTTPKKNK